MYDSELMTEKKCAIYQQTSNTLRVTKMRSAKPYTSIRSYNDTILALRYRRTGKNVYQHSGCAQATGRRGATRYVEAICRIQATRRLAFLPGGAQRFSLSCGRVSLK